MNERLDMQNIIWASVYGASFALEVRSHLSLGRELTDKDVERFIEEAAAVADWEQEVARKKEGAECTVRAQLVDRLLEDALRHD